MPAPRSLSLLTVGFLFGLLSVLTIAIAGRHAPVEAIGTRAGAGVSIENRAFTPAAVTVTVGSAVTWTNRDGQTHTVTGAGWDSGPLGFGQSDTRAFDAPGTFDYACRIHPEMTGRVAVTGALPPGSVTIEGFAFDPEVITITAGAAITWTNRDSSGHSAVAADGSWQTPILGRGQSAAVRFDRPGVYEYACGPHPEMHGLVVVRPAAATVFLPFVGRATRSVW